MSDRTFERAYGAFPFAELVRLSLVLAGFVGGQRRQQPARDTAVARASV